MTPYGIPPPDGPKPADLDVRIDARTGVLNEVIDGLGGELNRRIADRTADLRKVRSKLNHTLTGRINARTATVAGVAQDLGASLGERVATRDILLNLVPPGAESMVPERTALPPAPSVAPNETATAGWYVWHDSSGHTYTVTQGKPGGWPAQLFDPPVVFDTEETAIDYVVQHTGTPYLVQRGIPVRERPPPAPRPAQPPILPPTVPGGEGLTDEGIPILEGEPGWYCYHDVNGNILINYLDAKAAFGMSADTGPYSSEAEARASCVGEGELPPRPSPLPEPTGPPTTDQQPPQPCTPQDTETKPEPPPVSQPFPPQQLFPCVGTVCERLFKLRIALVRYGSLLLSENVQGQMVPSMSMDWWRGVLTEIADSASTTQNVLALVERVQASVKQHRVIQSYIDSLRACVADRIDDVLALLAVRGALVWVGSMGAMLSFTGSKGTSGGMSVSAGANFAPAGLTRSEQAFVPYNYGIGISGGTGYGISGGTGNSAGMASSINLFVVPLIDIVDLLIRWAQPWSPPNLTDATDQYIRGFIDQPTYQCYVEMAGFEYDSFIPTAQARFHRPDWRIAEHAYRRGIISSEDRYNYYIKDAIHEPRDQRVFEQIFTQLPTVSDVLHFLQRNVFDTDYVADYSLMEGFEERFWATFGGSLYAQGISKETAGYHYAAHWINPAPTQMQEMVYRLRPTKPGVAHSFTVHDYERILAEQDVAPYFRKRFAEIVHRVPALGYLRDMYRQFVLSDDELVSYHQDIGYNELDSRKFLEIDKIQRARMRAQQSHGWTTINASHAYVMGRIDGERHTELFARLGYTAAEASDAREVAQIEMDRGVFLRARSRALTTSITFIRQALQAGVLPDNAAKQMLTQAGWPVKFAVALVEQEQALSKVKSVQEVIKAVKRQYLQAYISAETAATALRQIGVEEADTLQYLAQWQLLFTPTRKRRTAQQITKDVASGQLATAEGLARLLLLGYDDADTRLFLADAQQQVSRRAAAELSRQERVAQRQQTEVARQQRAAAAQSQRLLRQLMRLAPPAKLQKWAALGIVGHARFRSLMATYGYDAADIERYWSEACAKKGAACEEVAPLDLLPPSLPGSPASGGPGPP